ncbi:MAG: metalloprotease [Pseudolabrys sp.]|nr:metalloprotease [Pseudolabrys sp.]
MIPKSGNKDFDFALAQTLAKISNLLDATPGFAYYDDYDGMNAFASPRVRLSNADGTVLFGQNLLKRLMQGNDHPELGVAAVCAHEFGHILQYKRGLTQIVGAGQPTVKRVELQADFFAGYFAGTRKREKPDFPAAVFAMTQYNFGDNMINHPSHHGTPNERAAAIVRGFEVAYAEKRNLADAISISINYAKSL